MFDLDWIPRFDLQAIAQRPPTIWRYREALPIDNEESIISFDEGFTPLSRLVIDDHEIWVKQDHLFASGSYKDRGASLMISKVNSLGIDHVVEDSSGNAGAAVAAYCARAGIACDIYAPASTSAGKLTQIRWYGAQLCPIPGSRADTSTAVMRAADGIYYASHSWNPYFFHGTKTWAFEVCEQLSWRAPDVAILPVGNGTLLLGAAIGFSELLTAGVIKQMPRLIGVQALGCAPLYQASLRGWQITTDVAVLSTLAEGIAITQPIRGQQILDAVRKSGGAMVAVSEEEIHDTLRWLGHQGWYVEPTSAATIAGVRQALRHLDKDQIVVSTLTGHGLKSTGKIGHLFDDASGEA